MSGPAALDEIGSAPVVTPLCDGPRVQNYSDVIQPEARRMHVLPTSELTAPDVALEACARFDADVAEPGICAGCGWLDDEHRVLDAAA